MRKKLRIILLLLAVWFISVGIRAEGSTLIIELTNGGKVGLILEAKPTLRFSGSEMVINSQTFTGSYQRTDIKRFYFKDATGIEETETTGLLVSITQIGVNRYQVSGLQSKDRIIVANLSGHQYGICVEDNGIGAVVDLSTCPKGVYVIKVGNKQTLKITRR
jgi:hypothetical protein